MDPRIGEFVTTEAPDADFIIWGYPDDEGIRLSHGRIGAKLAPLQIREIFYKLTPPLNQNLIWKIFDAGYLHLEAPLETRHQRARKIASAWTRLGKNWITLGGGHDYGYSDAAGFIESQLAINQRPLVINFDAHLDVRPLERGLNSGTPFYRVLSEFKGQFDFIEVGIQPHCNSSAHALFVKENGGYILSIEDIRKQGLEACLAPHLSACKDRATFLSVDIDVFESTVAPGCSQSWPVGMKTDEFFLNLPRMLELLDIQAMGIYEVSPPLDVGLQTQRLAALIIYQYMVQTIQKKSSNHE